MGTKILIEPIFKNKEIIKVLPGLKYIASHLITQSTILSPSLIQVTHKEGKLIEQFELKEIRIVNEAIRYEQRFGSEFIKIEKPYLNFSWQK